MAPSDKLGDLVARISANGKGLLQRKQVLEKVGGDSKLLRVLGYVQEAVVLPPVVAFSLRPLPGIWKYVRVDPANDLAVMELSVPEFLLLKEQVVDSEQLATGDYALELNTAPFEYQLRRIAQSDSMSNGLQFVNGNVPAKLLEDKKPGAEALLAFVKKHSYKGESLLVNDKITGVDAVRAALTKAYDQLRPLDPETPHSAFDAVLRALGLDKGWGDTAKRTRDNLRLLLEILEAPQTEPAALAEFFSAVPVLFKVLIMVPYDSFAQDTDGQVVHILDQVRALEEHLLLRYKEQGLDDAIPNILIVTRPLPGAAVGISPGQVLEPVGNTRYTNIVRLPFSADKDGILSKWISRFELCPYLDIYTEELDVGSYSNGILVGTLLVHRLDATQGTIADALDKSMYLDPDLKDSSPANGSLWWRVGTPAVILLLGLATLSLANPRPKGTNGGQLEGFMLFAIAETGFLGIINMLRNL